MKLKMSTPLLLFMAASLFLMAACGSSGPQKAIDGLSKALETKDTELLKRHVDIPRLARAMAEAAQEEQDKIWKQAGMASNPFSSLIPQITDSQMIKSITDEFPRSVANGQLIYASRQKGMPWDPDALKKTTIEETGTNSAVAAVDSPTGIRSFLSLRRGDDGTWRITGYYDKKAQAEYWCSDQRITDIKAENDKRIAAAEKINKERLAQWENRKADFDKKQAQYDSWKADCAAEEETLKAAFVNDLDSVRMTVVSKEMPKVKKYSFADPEDCLQLKVRMENQNSRPVTIKTLSFVTTETASGTAFKQREISIRDLLTIPSGKSYIKDFSFFLGSGLDLPEAQQIVNGVATLVLSAETIVIDNKKLDRSRGAGSLETSAKCRAFKLQPIDPGPKPDMKEVKPKLLEI